MTKPTGPMTMAELLALPVAVDPRGDGHCAWMSLWILTDEGRQLVQGASPGTAEVTAPAIGVAA